MNGTLSLQMKNYVIDRKECETKEIERFFGLNSSQTPKENENVIEKKASKNQFQSQSFQKTVNERIHNGGKSHQCQTCEKRFRKPSELKKHERIHTGEVPFHTERGVVTQIG